MISLSGQHTYANTLRHRDTRLTHSAGECMSSNARTACPNFSRCSSSVPGLTSKLNCQCGLRCLSFFHHTRSISGHSPALQQATFPSYSSLFSTATKNSRVTNLISINENAVMPLFFLFLTTHSSFCSFNPLTCWF